MADKKDKRFELLKLEWQQRGEEVRLRINLSFQTIYFKLLILGVLAYYYFEKMSKASEGGNQGPDYNLLFFTVFATVVALFCLDLFLAYDHRLILIQGDDIEKKLGEYGYQPFRGADIGSLWRKLYRICHAGLTVIPTCLLFYHSVYLKLTSFLLVFVILLEICLWWSSCGCKKPNSKSQ